MAGVNTQTQFTGQVGPLKMEIGYIPSADITEATGVEATALAKTHSVPTSLREVNAGWMVCSSTSGGIRGCITAAGSVCTGHASGIPAIDFSMDITCTGGAISGGWGDFYLIFGS